MVAACLAMAACASDPAPVGTATPVSPCILEQRPVVLADGTELYIEPQALMREGDDWLVVGSPSYEFAVAPGQDAVNLSRNQHIGAWLGRPARALGKPTDGTIGSLLSTPLGDGRWAAIFDEIEPPSDSVSAFPSPVSYWYGEHDGTQWTLVEPLPLPPETRVDLRLSSNLVRVGDRLAWIARDSDQDRFDRLVWYERIDGVWRYERLPDELVEHVVLAVDEGSGLWLLLSGIDPDLPEWEKTLRLFREGPPRKLVSRVAVVDAAHAIYQQNLELGPNGATVSWAVVTPEGTPAFTRTRIREGGSADSIVELDDDVEHLYSLTMPDGALAWIAEHHVDRLARREELRLLRLDGSRVVRAATLPSPFTGFFEVAPNGRDEVLLVGPQMGLAPPETPVRSLILRLSTSC
jgi:hypothetical protein